MKGKFVTDLFKPVNKIFKTFKTVNILPKKNAKWKFNEIIPLGKGDEMFDALRCESLCGCAFPAEF